MATVALETGFGASALRLLTKPLTATFNFLIALAESNQRLRLATELNEMTDAQLAEKGLRREDIVHHVFKGHMGF